jgi:hypothetical protein
VFAAGSGIKGPPIFATRNEIRRYSSALGLCKFPAIMRSIPEQRWSTSIPKVAVNPALYVWKRAREIWIIHSPTQQRTSKGLDYPEHMFQHLILNAEP